LPGAGQQGRPAGGGPPRRPAPGPAGPVPGRPGAGGGAGRAVRPARPLRAPAQGAPDAGGLTPGSIVSDTSTLPLTAFEYGQRRCARATSSSASARSGIDGSLMSSATVSPNLPSPIGPIPTLAVTVESSTSLSMRR